MKKLLLIAFCCSLFCVSLVNAKTETQKDIELKARIDKSIKPLSVKTAVIPFSASIDEDLLTVNFSTGLGSTTIKIEDSYGVVVFENTLDIQGDYTLPISLAGMEDGTYLIEVSTSSKMWYGEFDK